MKFTFWKVWGVASLVAGCGSLEDSAQNISSIQGYELQERRVPECGVEAYKSGEHSSCGIQSYKEARSPACGVELYKKVKSSKCSGYRASSVYEKRKTSTCGGSNPRDHLKCPAGELHHSYTAYTEDCWKNAFDKSKRWKGIQKCTIPEIMNSCRMAEFGVEKYKSCRATAHGIERYKSCAHASFGVEKYKACTLRATTTEVEAKIATVKASYKDFALKLLQYQADYYAQIGGKQSLGCLITRYENDPLYVDIATDLKTLFAQTFGETYQGPFSCDLPVLTMDVCDVGDTSSRCASLAAYKKTRQWFTEELQVLKNLQDDVVARANASIKGQLATLSQDLAVEYEKSPVIDETFQKMNLKNTMSSINQGHAVKYNFRHELECKNTLDQVVLQSIGRTVANDTVFNIGSRLSGITAKCFYLVKGDIDGTVQWFSDLPGLFYGSNIFEVTSDGTVSTVPSIYTVYSVISN